MFSRYELKTITKRLVRGRNQSASEGKFLGSVAPYGYRAYKLVGMKGNSLRIEPKEAKVVRMIFDMYGKQGIGYNTIAHELNQMNIPSLTGNSFLSKHPVFNYSLCRFMFPADHSQINFII